MSIKLLYITNGIDSSGGLERVLSIKASMLADTYNYEVHILTLNQDSKEFFYNFSSKIKFHNIMAIGNPFQYIKQYRAGIKQQIAVIQPDILLVCDDGLKGLMLPLIIGKPCPMVYERHVSKNIEIKTDERSLFVKIINRLKFKCMDFGASFYDVFVVLTQGNLYEWHSHNLKVISNPLSFYPNESALIKNKKVIAIGKHSHQKGYDRLLQIWKIVTKEHPDWLLEIYGASNPDHDLNGLAKDLQIKDHVKFYKPVRNIKDKLLESSILVLTSRFEGFGMVLIEAMACGLPVVSFNCPHGPSDIISQGEDGILIENGDIDSFAKALMEFIKHEEKRIQMGAAAKQNVKRFLPENVMKQWDQLFKSLIKI